MPYYSIPPIVRYRCLAIAKSNAPVDTGNLRHNAIKLTRVTPYSFTIKYDANDAYYIEGLEEGITSKKHTGFIFGTYLQLGNLLQQFFNNNTKGFNNGGDAFNRVAKSSLIKALSTAEGSQERQWRNMQSKLRANGATYSWR